MTVEIESSLPLAANTAESSSDPHTKRVKSLLSHLPALKIPQEAQELTTFTLFPKLPFEYVQEFLHLAFIEFDALRKC